VSGFKDALNRIAAEIPETQVVMIIGTDGIPIEKLVCHPAQNLEAVAAEYTTLLRASLSAAADTGLGELHELNVVAEKMSALMIGITAEYFLFAAFSPGVVIGHARFAMRMAGMGLEKEFL
jgi:predicted regulator of Ras-like GTPase activity (Roadblock/LC7/MglB family)